MQLLDPTTDFVFKKLFAQAPALLAELINAVRSTAPPAVALEVLNPTITAEELTGKFRSAKRGQTQAGDHIVICSIDEPVLTPLG